MESGTGIGIERQRQRRDRADTESARANPGNWVCREAQRHEEEGRRSEERGGC